MTLGWIKFSLLASLLAIVATLSFDAWSRLEMVEKISRISFAETPIGRTQVSPGAREENLMLPHSSVDARWWVIHTRQMLREGAWRVRQTPLDNAPEGREVHWSSFLMWVLAGLAWIRSIGTGDPAWHFVADAALAAGPLLMTVLFLGLFWSARRAFGSAPALTYLLSLLTCNAVLRTFQLGEADHHGIVLAFASACVLCLLAGGSGFAKKKRSSCTELVCCIGFLWRSRFVGQRCNHAPYSGRNGSRRLADGLAFQQIQGNSIPSTLSLVCMVNRRLLRQFGLLRTGVFPLPHGLAIGGESPRLCLRLAGRRMASFSNLKRLPRGSHPLSILRSLDHSGNLCVACTDSPPRNCLCRRASFLGIGHLSFIAPQGIHPRVPKPGRSCGVEKTGSSGSIAHPLLGIVRAYRNAYPLDQKEHGHLYTPGLDSSGTTDICHADTRLLASALEFGCLCPVGTLGSCSGIRHPSTSCGNALAPFSHNRHTHRPVDRTAHRSAAHGFKHRQRRKDLPECPIL